MSDESIAIALGKIGSRAFTDLPKGHVRVNPADVEAAGLGLDEVRLWVAQHGGREVRQSLSDRSLRPGKVTARSRIVRYFQVPQDQLDA